jgi:hypothetical protein
MAILQLGSKKIIAKLAVFTVRFSPKTKSEPQNGFGLRNFSANAYRNVLLPA